MFSARPLNALQQEYIRKGKKIPFKIIKTIKIRKSHGEVLMLMLMMMMIAFFVVVVSSPRVQAAGVEPSAGP